MSRRDEIAEAALALGEDDRAYLAELLERSLTSSDFAGPEIAEAWSREIDRRIERYQRGETTAIDMETSLQNMRDALDKFRSQRASS